MTAPAGGGRVAEQRPQDELELAQRLVQRCGLSDADLLRIKAVMEQSDLRFPEAALRLGVVTREDIEACRRHEVVEPVARPTAELRVITDPFDPQGERVRALRTELLMRRGDEEGNVVAIVSPMAQEGRSRLAAEIAVALAQLGQPTLLVDADLRRPRQHSLFGLGVTRGLADALKNRSGPEFQGVTGLPQLSLLTAGMPASSPLELLSDPLFARLLSGWKRRYRHVIFDTPPISEFSDGLAVVTAAHNALVLLRMRHTPIAASREMLHRLASAQARVLGSVVARF